MNYSPAPPTPAIVHDVRTFGADSTGASDSLSAIRRALDAAQPGEKLVFPPGRYSYSSSFFVRKLGVELFGYGATLHATNPDSQALIIQAHDVGVYGFDFTAVTAGRRTAPWHSRIAVWKDEGGRYHPVERVRIQAVKIGPSDGCPNGGSAGGIMLLHAHDFLVADCAVWRTLADGIHITWGSRDGFVFNNEVGENGDDMIAVVSYASKIAAEVDSAAALEAEWDDREEQGLCRNIRILGNRGRNQYWGRGISVVGGRTVAIAGNVIEGCPVAAGILVAREANYQTFGVSDVLVRENDVRYVQTTRSPYDPDGTFAARPRSGHGAFEAHCGLFEDEALSPLLRARLAVRDVRFSKNRVQHALVPALRTGVAFEGQACGPRRMVTGDLENVSWLG